MDELFRYRDANRETMNRYGAKFIIMHGQHQESRSPSDWFSEGTMAIVVGYDGTQEF